MDRSDKALLAAFLLAAVFGTSTWCLMHDDGAIILASGWLGNFWDLYASQIPDRAVAVLMLHGPAWAARAAFDLDPRSYITLAHALYFAVPLLLWLILRRIERDRLFSRLYLAIILPMVYFPTELLFGVGLWMIWLALVSDEAQSTSGVVLTTLPLGAIMAFSHPVLALLGVLFAGVGLALPLFGQYLSKRTLLAMAALSVALLGTHFALAHWLPPANLTDGATQQANQLAYINPRWMLRTIVHFPMLAALWILLLVPAAGTLRLEGRILSLAIAVVALLGLWFAAVSTGLKTSAWSRHSGLYVMTVALVFALAHPAKWLACCERPLVLFATICAVGTISFNVDVWLFGRFLDRDLRPGIVDAMTVDEPWPSRPPPLAARTLFKYGAATDYVRDVVMPTYDQSRIPLAFYSFFRSGRQSVLYHLSGGGADWLPYQCSAAGRALDQAHDAQNRQFLQFLAEHYCGR